MSEKQPFVPGTNWNDKEFLAMVKDDLSTPLEKALAQRLAGLITAYGNLDQWWRDYTAEQGRYITGELKEDDLTLERPGRDDVEWGLSPEYREFFPESLGFWGF